MRKLLVWTKIHRHRHAWFTTFVHGSISNRGYEAGNHWFSWVSQSAVSFDNQDSADDLLMLLLGCWSETLHTRRYFSLHVSVGEGKNNCSKCSTMSESSANGRKMPLSSSECIHLLLPACLMFLPIKIKHSLYHHSARNTTFVYSQNRKTILLNYDSSRVFETGGRNDVSDFARHTYSAFQCSL